MLPVYLLCSVGTVDNFGRPPLVHFFKCIGRLVDISLQSSSLQTKEMNDFQISHYFSAVPHQSAQICPEAQDAEQAEQSATHAMDWLESCFRYFILYISPGQVLYGQELNLVIFSHIFIFLKDSIPCNKTRSPWDFPHNTNTYFSLNKALYFII